MEKNRLADLIKYTPELRTLNNINITEREADIVACVINRRMCDLSIAHQLGINKRTVETHLRNITQKLRCSTQKLKEIIEETGKTELFLNHYNLLLLFRQFQGILDKIKKRNPISVFKKECILFYADLSLHPMLNKVRTSFVHVEINVKLEPFDPQIASESILQGAKCLIVADKKESMIPDALVRYRLDYTSYPTIFNFILDIIDHVNNDSVIKELIHQFSQKTRGWGGLDTRVLKDVSLTDRLEDTSDFRYKRSRYRNQLRLVHFIMIFLVLSTVVWISTARFYTNDHPRSELYFPSQRLLLGRSELVSLIQKCLYPQTSEPNISTIALCGVGGAGKTILARMVARQHRGIIWEVNAETDTTLKDAFKELAYALGQSDEDRAKLKFIFSLGSIKEQSSQICLFVRNKLIKNPKWLLIFDNVESFSRIQEYLPTDPLVWGTGHVIITSRNANFLSLEARNVIKVDALSKEESIKLFSQIKWGREDVKPQEKQLLAAFLNKIPAFPLDVVIAANFLRQSPEVDYCQYLDNLNDNVRQLDLSDRLKANSDYTQTRHDIISVSLQKLLNNPTFLDAMVLIGLLDSQNIPKAMLLRITDFASVERILYELKKYSLITSESQVNGVNVLSMHRSIHKSLSEYIFKYLDINSNEYLIQKAIEAFESYANELLATVNYQSIYAMIPHAESILNKSQLSNFPRAIVEVTYANLLSTVPAHSVKVVQLLERSLTVLERAPIQTREHSLRIAVTLSILGDRYRSLCQFGEARPMLEQSVKLYEELAPTSIETAKAYGRLGTLYRTEGSHEKTQELFLKSIEIYNKYPESYHPVDKLIALGLNARDIGEYKKSLEYLYSNLALVKDKKDPWHFWVLSYLGSVYIDTGNYDKAWDCLQQAEKYFAQSQDDQAVSVPYAWRLAYMGTTQVFNKKVDESLKTLQKSYEIFTTLTTGKEMHGMCFKVVLPSMGYAYLLKGNYKKAAEIFADSLRLLEKHYGKGHFQTGRVINCLGLVAFKENRINEAESFMKRAADIFNKYQHTDVFIPLETLSDLYYEQYLRALKTKKFKEADIYKQKTKECCCQAFNVVKIKMPIDSAHLKRIVLKINKRAL